MPFGRLAEGNPQCLRHPFAVVPVGPPAVGDVADLDHLRRVPFELQRRFGEVGLLLPLAVAIWFVAEGAAVVPVHPHRAVAVVAVVGAAGGIGGPAVNTF